MGKAARDDLIFKLCEVIAVKVNAMLEFAMAIRDIMQTGQSAMTWAR